MYSDLLILDSKGKVETLSRVWTDITGAIPLVVATGGQLLVQPDSLDPLLITKGFIDTRHVANEPMVKRLRKAIAEAKNVWIATDPDAEGEVIAQDIMSGCPVLSRAFRLRLHGLGASSVKQAIAEAEPLNCVESAAYWAPAQSAHGRRLLDRIVAGVFGTPDYPVGRILSGFLSRAKSGPAKYVPPMGVPMNLADLLMAVELDDLTFEVIYDAAQALYESGKMTFPLTGSRCLPEWMRPVVEKTSRRLGGKLLAQLPIGMHSGLCPLADADELARLADDCRFPAQGQSVRRRVLSVVARAAVGLPPPIRIGKPLSVQRRILSALVDAGIGHPAIYVRFCTENAAQDILGENGWLTVTGHEWANWQPDWLDAGFVAITEVLLDTGEGRYQDRLLEIMNQMPLSAKERIIDAFRNPMFSEGRSPVPSKTPPVSAERVGLSEENERLDQEAPRLVEPSVVVEQYDGQEVLRREEFSEPDPDGEAIPQESPEAFELQLINNISQWLV